MNEMSVRLQKLVEERAAGLSDNSSNRGAKDIQVNTLLSLQKVEAPTASKSTLWKSPFDNILHNSDFHDF